MNTILLFFKMNCITLNNKYIFILISKSKDRKEQVDDVHVNADRRNCPIALIIFMVLKLAYINQKHH